MSKRIRHRHQRRRIYYRVLWPDGAHAVISAQQFIAGVAAGNLIPDPNDKRAARVPNRLTVTIDRATGELTFSARSKPVLTVPAPNSTRPLLRNWLESERTLTRREARRIMRASLPRVDTEGVRLY
jgi:hypothetical protein